MVGGFILKMLERKIGKADPPAAARTMTAQIVHLKQLHAKRQQLQIGGQLTGIFNIVHNGAAKLNACCNAFDLPRISLAGLTVNGVFRLYFRQTNACKIAGIGYKAVSELKPGTFDRRSGTEKPQNGGVVILVVGICSISLHLLRTSSVRIFPFKLLPGIMGRLV